MNNFTGGYVSEWWPPLQKYSPGITKEKWLEILKNTNIFGENSLKMLAAMKYLGGEATCTYLADKFGNDALYYKTTALRAAERAFKYTGCPVIDGSENVRWWPILFVGKRDNQGESGAVIWKIRSELDEALDEFGIDRYLPEVMAEDAGTENEVTVKEHIDAIKEYIAAKGFSYGVTPVENFYLSLKAKPFVILTGASGTGKTSLVRLFAEAIGAEYCHVSVRPDWSDSSDLFGHVDLNQRFIKGDIIDFVKSAEGHPAKPYILCLDEMNLARVEYYMSDILSALETRRFENGRIVTDAVVSESIYGNDYDAKRKYGKVILPCNLYIVGTVNVEETTFPLGKKVLDRLNTVELSRVNLLDLPSFEDTEVTAQVLTNDFLVSEYITLNDCNAADREYIEDICTRLQRINAISEKANAHVGYRVRDEIVFYMLNNKEADLLEENKAFDSQLMQRILPGIQGGSEAVKDMLVELLKLCESEKYSMSAKKINFMIERYEEDGFTSYWL